MRLLSIALTMAIVVLLAVPAHAKVDPRRTLVDDGDVELLALNIYHEARGEGRKGMLAVGWIVLNRMADPAFPKSVHEVVLQGADRAACQWGWLCDRRADAPRQGAAWRQAKEIARQLLTSPPPDPTGGALWLRRVGQPEPSWGIEVVRTARIGNHVFYGRELQIQPPKTRPTKVAALDE